MKDNFSREINYLRISVTDKCNLRCMYCMPEEGVPQKNHSELLSLEHIAEITSIAASLGIKKVRITGGEPLVRRGITELVREIAAIPGIEDIAMTTNGILLPQMAEELKKAGLNRVNISLDTFDPDKYHKITRLGSLAEAVEGIRAAEKAGLGPIKLNTVLVGGFNDDEIADLVELTRLRPFELRFIEFMPIGSPIFPESAYIPVSTVLDKVPELSPVGVSGTAKLYALPNALGKVGLISPISSHFCGTCNRIRLTADGKLKPCLHSAEEISVVGLHGDELSETLKSAIFHKPAMHGLLTHDHHSEAIRDMNSIGG